MAAVSVSTIVEELRNLPSDTKLEIIGELWDTIPSEEVPVPDEVLDEMDRRFAEYQQNPERAMPWAEVRASIERELKSR